jgi:hypothetical protein
MANLVHNERIKYAASFFNNIGVASFAGGAIIPLVSLSATNASGFRIWWPLIVGITLGVFFLFSSYHLLGSLKE